MTLYRVALKIAKNKQEIIFRYKAVAIENNDDQ